MFNIGEWLTDSLISGVNNGIFAREYVAMMAINYMLKGMLTSEQVQEIAERTVVKMQEPVMVPEEEETPST